MQLSDDALGGGLVLSAEVERVDHATCDDAPSEIVADLAQATARQKQKMCIRDRFYAQQLPGVEGQLSRYRHGSYSDDGLLLSLIHI